MVIIKLDCAYFKTNINYVSLKLMFSIIQYGWTGLMKASANGHTSTVSVLLSEGKADPNITDEVKLH